MTKFSFQFSASLDHALDGGASCTSKRSRCTFGEGGAAVRYISMIKQPHCSTCSSSSSSSDATAAVRRVGRTRARQCSLEMKALKGALRGLLSAYFAHYHQSNWPIFRKRAYYYCGGGVVVCSTAAAGAKTNVQLAGPGRVISKHSS